MHHHQRASIHQCQARLVSLEYLVRFGQDRLVGYLKHILLRRSNSSFLQRLADVTYRARYPKYRLQAGLDATHTPWHSGDQRHYRLVDERLVQIQNRLLRLRTWLLWKQGRKQATSGFILQFVQKLTRDTVGLRQLTYVTPRTVGVQHGQGQLKPTGHVYIGQSIIHTRPPWVLRF